MVVDWLFNDQPLYTGSRIHSQNDFGILFLFLHKSFEFNFDTRIPIFRLHHVVHSRTDSRGLWHIHSTRYKRPWARQSQLQYRRRRQGRRTFGAPARAIAGQDRDAREHGQIPSRGNP